MNTEQAIVIHDCVRGSLTGGLTFPDIVSRIAAIGVERYHVDYSRFEKTFYLTDGSSICVTIPWEKFPIGQAFSAVEVESAVRESQRGEHTYLDFLRKTMDAGCVGYFVQITGRRVIYFGRRGESHIELFPGSPAE